MSRKATLVAILAVVLFAVLLIGSTTTQATERNVAISVKSYHQDRASSTRTIVSTLTQSARWLYSQVDRLVTPDESAQIGERGKRLPLSQSDNNEIKSILPGPWVYPPPDTGSGEGN